MKIKFLLLGTSLSFLPLTVNAQCVETTNCETLGYTETSCNGGKGVKCPFGNKWACLGANEEEIREKLCQELGFTLTCTGTGYAGGAGSACDGKYAYCTCSSGYEWKSGSCQKKEILTGADGNVYKCNGKVVGVKAPEMNFYVAMKDLGTYPWKQANSSCSNYIFCNTAKGALPSFEQLRTIYKNKSALNSLLSANGGTAFSDNFYTYYWSSTISSSGTHRVIDISDGNDDGFADSTHHYALPVLTSW